MNHKIILKTTARIMLLVGGLLLLPLICSIFYREGQSVYNAYLQSMAIIALVFFPFSRIKIENDKIYVAEGCVITVLTYIFISLFGAFPFLFSKIVPTYLDAVFEMASGITTTGATIISDLSIVPNSIFLWRSIAIFLGGMGVLMLALAVLNDKNPSTINLMRAEVPGPEVTKMTSKLKDGAKLLYRIYIVLTLVIFIALIAVGMGAFEAINYAMSTAGTGGFGTRPSLLHFNNSKIEVVIALGSLFSGINFALYNFLVLKKFNLFFRNEELVWYLILVIFSTFAIYADINIDYNNNLTALKDSFVTVANISATTGFTTIRYAHISTFSEILLVILMFLGGMAGSTSGGLKMSRMIIGIKIISNRVKLTINPRRKTTVRINGQSLSKDLLRSVDTYITIYFLLFFIFFLLCSINMPSFESAFTTVATCFNNSGPALGVGRELRYYLLPNYNKVVLMLAMFFGRLEIMPVLVFLSPSSWRRHNE